MYLAPIFKQVSDCPRCFSKLLLKKDDKRSICYGGRRLWRFPAWSCCFFQKRQNGHENRRTDSVPDCFFQFRLFHLGDYIDLRIKSQAEAALQLFGR